MSWIESERMREIPFSDIRTVFEKVDALKAHGSSPIPFHIGQPDFDTPEHIKQAACQALNQGLTAYTSNYGLPALRAAIAEKLANENGLRVDPDRQIIVTVGTNEAIFLAMMALLNPGDEVLIPDPSWPHYFHCARLAGAVPVSVPLHLENGFQLDPSDLESRRTRRTRMLVLNSPHNPTGAVFSQASLQEIARFIAKYHLLLVSDEIYEKMIYHGQPHFSPGSIEEIQDQTITVNGFSKAYAMTGWRVGYLAASPDLVNPMIRVHQYTTICATSFAQAGALAALRGPQDCVARMVSEFAIRRRVLLDGLQGVPGMNFVAPQGAFYLFPEIKVPGKSSQAIALQFLDQAGVAMIPGSAFGKYGEGFIRLSFACSLDQVQKGVRAITDFWRQYPATQK